VTLALPSIFLTVSVFTLEKGGKRKSLQGEKKGREKENHRIKQEN